MKIVVVMDSFKGSLTSKEAGEAVKQGILAADASAEVLVYPFADGGEGTLDAFLCADSGSRIIRIPVSDPLGRRIAAAYGVLSDGTVVIETAQAIGLCLLKEEERDPLSTTTRGIGELIRHAVDSGSRRFIVALGGSSTNDCGIGMLKELGFGILDKDRVPVEDGATGLFRAASLTCDQVLPFLEDCSFIVACDVRNPLTGADGASRVYAPQKGASPEDVEKMDAWMEAFSEVVNKYYPESNPDAEGAGAAGGLGFAFLTFLHGEMVPGAQVLLERTEIEKEIAEADLIITGEGRMDAQTAMGKAPAQIARIAKRYGKTVIAIAGCVSDDIGKCRDAGIDAIYPATPAAMRIQDAMRPDIAMDNVKRTACEIMRHVIAVDLV